MHEKKGLCELSSEVFTAPQLLDREASFLPVDRWRRLYFAARELEVFLPLEARNVIKTPEGRSAVLEVGLPSLRVIHEVISEDRNFLKEEADKSSEGLAGMLKVTNCIFGFAKSFVPGEAEDSSLSHEEQDGLFEAQILRRNLLDFGVSLVGSKCREIDEILEDSNASLEDKLSALEAISYCGFFTKLNRLFDQKDVFELLAKYVPGVLDSLGRDKSKPDNVPLGVRVATILDNMKEIAYGENDQKIFLKILNDFFNASDGENLEIAGEVLASQLYKSLEEDDMGSYLIARIRAFDMLKKFGLDGSTLVIYWLGNGDKKHGAFFLADNIRTVFSLESKKRGIISTLSSRFGIEYFARYPEEVLLRKYEEMEEKDSRPVGVIVYPGTDHNGGFYNRDLLRNFFDDLHGNAKLVVWEADSNLELVHALNFTRNNYGRISYLLLGGHGEKDRIELGRWNKNSVIRKRDIKRKGALSLRNAFINNPTIVLNSCNTGIAGGIAEAMSEIGATVIAPPEPISFERIIVSEVRDDGHVDMFVRYNESVAPVVY